MAAVTVLSCVHVLSLAMLVIAASQGPQPGTLNHGTNKETETELSRGSELPNTTSSIQTKYSQSHPGGVLNNYSVLAANSTGRHILETHRILELQLEKYARDFPITDELLEALEEMGQWMDIPDDELQHLQQDESYPNYHLHGQPYPPRQTYKHKVEHLGVLLRRRVERLRQTPNQRVELVFLVDSSTTVGPGNFANELIFVRKLLADFTVDQRTTRVALVTFSSQDRVVRHVDHLGQSDDVHNKCSLLEEELGRIRYTGGGTDTLGAFQEAEVSNMIHT